MTTAMDIISRVVRILHDEEFTRWSRSELLDWVNEALVSIATVPGAYSKTIKMNLAHGTRQVLPQDAISLVTVSRNFDGDIPLTAVTVTSRELLDAFRPMWHMLSERPLVENYIYDDRKPKEFSVYPPNDGTGCIEVTYVGIPERVGENDQLPFDDTYIPAIVNYTVYRAYCKESDYSSGIQNAQGFYQAYQSELAAVSGVRGSMTPNAALLPDTTVNPTGGTE